MEDMRETLGSISKDSLSGESTEAASRILYQRDVLLFPGELGRHALPMEGQS